MISKAAFDLQIPTKYEIRTMRDSLKDVLRGKYPCRFEVDILRSFARKARFFLCDFDAIG